MKYCTFLSLIPHPINSYDQMANGISIEHINMHLNQIVIQLRPWEAGKV